MFDYIYGKICFGSDGGGTSGGGHGGGGGGGYGDLSEGAIDAIENANTASNIDTAVGYAKDLAEAFAPNNESLNRGLKAAKKASGIQKDAISGKQTTIEDAAIDKLQDTIKDRVVDQVAKGVAGSKPGAGMLVDGALNTAKAFNEALAPSAEEVAKHNDIVDAVNTPPEQRTTAQQLSAKQELQRKSAIEKALQQTLGSGQHQAANPSTDPTNKNYDYQNRGYDNDRDYDGQSVSDLERTCFVAATPILMMDGNTKPIKDISEGDEVASFDGFGALQSGKVVAKFNYEEKNVLFVDGVTVTAAHRFLDSSGQFRAIGEFSVGDTLVLSNGEFHEIKELYQLDEKHPVYNFTVEGLNTYVAGGFRVHNIKPIAIDLNGDGELALVDIEESAVFFDTDGDGYQENVGWVGSDDGFLVIDKDADGKIVGDELVIAAQTDADDTDIEALATLYDSNNDGVLDNQDTDFDRFKIWQDLNQDGIVNDGELKTLEAWGIKSVDLTVTKSKTEYNSNHLLGTTSLTKLNGDQLLVGDIDLHASDVGVNLEETGEGVRLKASNDIEFYYAKKGHVLNGSAEQLDVRALYGNDQADTLSAGNKQSVVLSGGAGDDILAGGSGDDWLSGDEGADSLSGGAGNDRLIIDGNDTNIDGGDGYDVAYAVGDTGVTLDLDASNLEAVIGSKANDSLTSSGSKNVHVSGADGNDQLTTGSGDDFLVGGAGADKFSAGAGNDRLFIDAEDNQADIRAGDGEDTIHISTSEGVDLDLSVIEVENAYGNSGNDVFRNTNGNNVFISGGAGDDNIQGGSGNDILEGGIGSDILDGSTGFNFVSYESSEDEVNVNLSNNAVSGGDAEGDTITNFKGIFGSEYGDTLTGTSEYNVIFGNGGNDLISGGDSGDYLDGGDGSDTISYENSNAAVQVDLKENTATGGHAEDDRLFSIENLIGSSSNDTLTGNGSDNTLEGGAGADTLSAGEGNDYLSYRSSTVGVTVDLNAKTVSGGHAEGDTIDGFEHAIGSNFDDNLTSQASGSKLYGFAGSDTLTGLEGEDRIEGGAGADILDGGADVDTLSYEGSDTGVNVNLETGVTSGGHADGDTISNFENIQGSYGDDTLTGDANDNVIEGDLGADTIDGGAGIDTASYEDAYFGVNVDLKRGGGRQHDQLAIELDSNRLSGSAVIDVQDNKRAQHQGTELSAAYTLATIAAASGWATTSLALDRGDDVNASIGAILSAQHSLTEGEVRPIDQAYLEVSFDAGVATIRYYRADGSLEGQFTVAVEDSATHKVSFGYDKYTGASVVSIDGQVAGSYNWISGLDVMAGSYGSNGATAIHEEADGGFLYSLGLLTDEAVNDTLINIENLRGSDNGDRLAGDDGDNVIEGNGGNDIINGGLGADTLSGGAGDDILIGGEGGGDTYIFNQRDGHDRIQNSGADSKVVFGEGIKEEDISFVKEGDDLVVKLQNYNFGELINSTTKGNQYDADITTLNDGSFVISWTAIGQDDVNGVFFQKYDPQGQPVGSETHISEGSHAAIEALPDGGFAVTWTKGGLRLQRYDSNGVAVGSETQVHSTVWGSKVHSEIKVLSDDSIVVVWTQDNSTGYDLVNFQRFDSSGNKIGNETKVNTTDTGNQYYPVVTELLDGGFVVSWMSRSKVLIGNQYESRYGILMQRYDNEGNAVGNETQITASASRSKIYPSMATLSNGDFVVAWDSNGITQQRYSALGEVVGEATRVSSGSGYFKSDPSITAMSDGGWVVAWEAHEDGSDDAILLQRFDANGGKVGNEVLVNAHYYSTQENPSVTALPNGEFVVTWQSRYQDGDGWGTYFKRYDPSMVDSLTIEGWFADENKQVTFELSDGFEADVNAINILGDATENTLEGTSSNDLIFGYEGNDGIIGGAGDDTLKGGAGSDDLYGGEGNDLLIGGDSDGDIYRYNLGDGKDIIENSGANGRVVFGNDITSDHLNFIKVGNDLQIMFSEVDQLTISGWYNDDQNKVRFELADGTEQIVLTGSSSNDSITGTNSKNFILGHAGDDTLNGGNESDELIGGAGNDLLIGGNSDGDIYHINLGDGDDRIQNTGINGKVIFGAEINVEFLSFSRVGDDLTVVIPGHDEITQSSNPGSSRSSSVNDISQPSAQTLTIENWFMDTGRRVSFQFSDGTFLAAGLFGDELQNNLTGTEFSNYIFGFEGNDTLNGAGGDDTLVGGHGSDDISGGAGNDLLIGGESDGDIYRFNLGDGQDRVQNNGLNAKVVLGTGISQENLDFVRSDDDLIIVVSSEDYLTIERWYNAAENQVSFELSDGTPLNIYTGTNQNENYTTSSNGGIIFGAEGDDVLTGSSYGDVLDGGRGNDTLIGGADGGDTYRFSAGDGNDRIKNTGADSKVVFGADITADNVEFFLEDNDLVARVLTAVKSESLVDGYLANFTRSENVLQLADGNYLIYKIQESDFDLYLKTQILNSKGETVNSESLFSLGHNDNVNYQDIIALPEGGYALVWVDNKEVRLQKFDELGETLGRQSLVSTDITNAKSDSKIISLNDGGLVSVWVSYGQDGNSSGVFFQKYNSEDDKVGTIIEETSSREETLVTNVETQVNTYTPNRQDNPDIASLASGGFVIVWQSYGQDGDNYGVYLQRYDADGTALGVEVQVSTETINRQRYPSITSLSDGGFVVVWESNAQSTYNSNIMLQRFDELGEKLGEETRVGTGKGQNPEISTLTDGSIIILWEEGGTIKIQHFSDDMKIISDEIIVIDTSINPGYKKPFISILEDNSFVVSWTDYHTKDIKSQRYTVDELTIENWVVDDENQVSFELQDGSSLEIPNFEPEINTADKNAFVREINDGDNAENNIEHTVSGNITFTDSDATDTHTATVETEGMGYLGDFTINFDHANKTILWNFSVEDAALDHLHDDDILTQKYRVNIKDSEGGLVTQIVTITITGSYDENSIPVISSSTGTENVLELTDGSIGENTLEHYTSGEIVFTDEDIANTHSVTYSPQSTNYLGTFTPVLDQETKTVTWNFTVLDAVLDHLAEGENLTQNYTVSVEDDQGGIVTQDVIITITGSYDKPEIHGDDQNNTLTGSELSERILGNAGDDTIDGGAGADDLSGGLGNDLLIGGNSDGDIYRYNLGDGQDRIRNTGNDAKLILGTGVTEDNIQFTQSGDDLIISLPNPIVANDITQNLDSDDYITVSGLSNGGYVTVTPYQASAHHFGDSVGAFEINLYQVDSSKIGDTIVVVGDQDTEYYPLSVTSMTNNDFVIVWTKYSDFGDNENPGTYLQRYNDSGQKSGSEIRLNNAINEDEIPPIITDLGINGYAASWNVVEEDTGRTTNYIQKYTLNGDTVGERIVIDEGLENSSATLLSDGTYIVSWTALNFQFTGDLFFQRYDQNNNKIGNEIKVNENPSSNDLIPLDFNFTPYVKSLIGGDFIVVWLSMNMGDNLLNTYLQRFNSDNEEIGERITFNSVEIGSDFSPNDIRNTRISVTDLLNEQYSAAGVRLDAINETSKLQISYQGTDDTVSNNNEIIIENWYNDNSDKLSIELEDGSIVGPSGQFEIYGDDGDNILTGFKPKNIIFGEGGDDVLTGNDGSDDLSGGKGNDILIGGDSVGDIYRYNLGDGQDLIRNTGLNAKVILGENIAEHDLRFYKSGDDLVVNIHKASQEVQVNNYTSLDQKNSSVVSLLNGDYLVTWESKGQDGDGYGVYLQRYDVAGNPIGSEVRVNSNTIEDQRYSNATALIDGGYIVTWTSYDQDGSGAGIYTQRYNEDGNAVGNETLINNHTSGDQKYSDIVAISDGGYIVSWQSKYQDGSGYGIYSQQYGADGNEVGAETLVNTHTSSDQRQPSIATFSDGGYIVSWQSLSQDGNGYGVYLQRFDSQGNKIGGETLVNSHSDSQQRNTSLVTLSNGDFVVAWESKYQDDSGYGIYLQRYDSNGNTIGDEALVNSYTSRDQKNVDIAAFDDGGFIVSWQSKNQDGDGYGIYTQIYDSDGNEVGTETLVNTYTSSDQREPSITTLDGGGYIVSWQSLSQDGDGYGVYYQKYSSLSEKHITIENWFVSNENQVEFNLHDGSSVEVEIIYIEGDNLGNELLNTSADDVFTGLAGNDTFVFKTDLGHDTITDFVAGAGSEDSIRIEGLNISTFDAVLQLAEQVGDDTVINIDDDNSITLKDVQKTALHADDFQFV